MAHSNTSPAVWIKADDHTNTPPAVWIKADAFPILAPVGASFPVAVATDPGTRWSSTGDLSTHKINRAGNPQVTHCASGCLSKPAGTDDSCK